VIREPIQELEEGLNKILAAWHEWSANFPDGIAYPTVAVFAKQWRTSRQYDDDNGAQEQDAHNDRMEIVDAAVNAIPIPWRTALHINARNLCTGVAVWRSARLPADDMERAAMVVAARALLVEELTTRGVNV
jgi:hypothetical protein